VTTLSKEFYDGRWDQANIPIKLRGIRLADYEHVSKSGEIARMKSEDFVADFRNRWISEGRAKSGDIPEDRSRIGQGLLLSGPNGTRKTTLAVAVLMEIQRLGMPYRGFYIRFSEWQRCLTDTFANEMTPRVATAKHMLAASEMVPLLVLDDLGQEYRSSTGFTRDKLHELLRVRYEAARPTIVTTNEDPDSMREIYGTSFDSFRHDAFGKPIEILGQDSRKPKRI
jgi:DNA replication protein DnaC